MILIVICFYHSSLDKSNESFNDIFDEVPIEISNSHLVGAYLWEIETDKKLQGISISGLDVSGATFMEKNLDVGVEYLEELCSEQSRFQNYQRAVYKQQAQFQKRVSINVPIPLLLNRANY